MEKIRKKYTLEYKIFAIAVSNQYGSISRAARELGIGIANFYYWKRLIIEGKLTLQRASDSDIERKELLKLRKEIKDVKVERDILKKGAGHLLLGRRARYQFIRENSEIFPVGKMCQVLNVDPSCYYKWIKGMPKSKAFRRIFIASEISRIYYWSQGRYGSPRIAMELAAKGIKACRSLVGKIMLEQHLRRVEKLKFKRTTISSSKYPAVENRLNQNFKVDRKNEVWVSDITYIHTAEGWAYLTTVIDLFDRKVIGWSLSKTMKSTDTSIAAFEKALRNRPLVGNERLIFHSDRGIQYASKNFVSILARDKHISRSMSGKGNCYDNAVAESFFKTLKAELVHYNTYATREEANDSIYEYIENFYNTRRRHSTLGNLTMEEFQNQWYCPDKKKLKEQ